MNKLLDSVSKVSITCRQVKNHSHTRNIKRFTFDKASCSIRCQLHYVKNLKEHYPSNRQVREQFYVIKRMFKKAVKKTRL
jgi:hypothetical protein